MEYISKEENTGASIPPMDKSEESVDQNNDVDEAKHTPTEDVPTGVEDGKEPLPVITDNVVIDNTENIIRPRKRRKRPQRHDRNKEETSDETGPIPENTALVKENQENDRNEISEQFETQTNNAVGERTGGGVLFYLENKEQHKENDNSVLLNEAQRGDQATVGLPNIFSIQSENNRLLKTEAKDGETHLDIITKTEPAEKRKRKKRRRRHDKQQEETSLETDLNHSDNVIVNEEQNSDQIERSGQFQTCSKRAASEKSGNGVVSHLENKEQHKEHYNNIYFTKAQGDHIPVGGDEVTIGSQDIFCVQSGFNKLINTDSKAGATHPNLIPNTESAKKRKKKKRLPDIKKKSSKVADSSLPLPPITSAPPPSIFYRKPRGDDVNVSEHAQDDSRTDLLVTDSKDERKLHREPLWICRQFCRFPITSFVIVTLCHLAVISTTVGLFVTGYDIFPIVFDELPLYIHNDVRLKELTWRERFQVPGFVLRPVYGFNIATGSRSEVKDTVEVIFEKKHGNILNRHDLRMIQRAEDGLFNHHRFKQYFCFVDYYRNCVKPQSILRLFDGTYSHVNPAFTDPEFTNITDVIYKASLYNDTRDFLFLFIGKDGRIEPGHVSTSITRTFFFMGWPLGRMENGRFGSLYDLEMFLVKEFKPQIEAARDGFLEPLMKVYYLSKMMMEYDLVQQALKDILLAIGSISFIFVFMCFQTGSLFITFFGILSILSSFLWTNLIYRYAFQYVYFGFFHVIALFLILGIGIDDLFVFYDTWRYTGHSEYPSDAHRLSDCFRRAAKTTFVTSLTTMAAFLVSGLSPLLPVRTFGIFAGVLVGINYIWVIIYFPVIILLHHLKFKHTWNKLHSLLLLIWLDKAGLSRTGRANNDLSETSSAATFSESNSTRALIQAEQKSIPDKKHQNCDSNSTHVFIDNEEKPNHAGTQSSDIYDKTSNGGAMKSPSSEKSTNSKNKGQRDILDEKVRISIHKDNKRDNNTYLKDSNMAPIDLKQIKHETIQAEKAEERRNRPRKTFEERNRIVNFLRNGFFDFMTLRAVKFVIPLVFIGVSIFFIYTATLIEPDTHQLRLFRSTHNYAIATEHHYFSFIRNHEDEYQRLYLVWGLGPADIDYCDLKSGDFCHGKAVIDYGFDMETDSAQLAMKRFCESLNSFDADLADRLRIRRDTSTKRLQIACFTQDFETFFESESQATNSWTGSRKYPQGMKLSLPVTSGNVSQLMSYNSQIYRYALSSDFDRYFQILLSYWMTNKYSIQATSDYFKYSNLLGEHTVTDTESAYYSFSGLYYGSRTLYVAVEINTTMDVYSLNYKDGLPIFREWENFINAVNAKMPPPLQNGFQVTENLWHWIHVQEELANSAVIGILVGLFSAWPILVFTTMNFVIGTVAVVTIGLVTSCVVGMIPLAGWKLGVLESINLCLVVGLSVDYVVHLAEAYRMSESKRRLDRVRNMLESIGLSIISGAITTIGAAIFMLFAQIQFFFQFGIFMISTIGISLMFSLFCFTTLMSIFGPQGNTGSISVLFSCITNKCRGSSPANKTDPDVDNESESQATNSWTGSRKYPQGMNLSLPVTSGNVSQLMSYNSQIYRYALSSDFDRYFQILLSYWMTNKYSIQATSDYFKYSNLLGEHTVTDTESAYYSFSGLYYGSRTLYVAVEINTTMDVYSLNYKDGLPIFREWENFINAVNAKMPPPLQNGFQVTENLWHWIHVQEELANSAVIGILVGLFSAWPILVFTTMNFVIGTVAVVTIGLVTSCVVGMIPLAGWKLGVLESINLCLVVVLSVDYVVHLAEAYRMSESTRRLDRVRNMLESIGLSIISGAITTIGAAIFMLFAQIQFFFQFGIFMISTIGISLMFSLFCFTTLMSIFGPQGNTGSISVLFSCITNKCRGSSPANKTDPDVDNEASTGCCCTPNKPLRLQDRLFDWISYKCNRNGEVI